MVKSLAKALWKAAVLLGGLWAASLMLFSPALPTEWRVPTGVVLGVATMAVIFSKRKAVLAVWTGLVLASAMLFYRLQPKLDRNWQPDVAKLPWAEINGDEVTIYNVRDAIYRSETDFDPNYKTITVRLSELKEADMLVTYWGMKPIAHIMVSFGFKDDTYLTFSIETRKTVGQSYSTIDGFYRNYELIFIVATERDLVSLRTNYRNPNEQVHLLPIRFNRKVAEKFFLAYLSNLNELRSKPRFYNTLTTNCTTQVLALAQTVSLRNLHYNWQILLSGYTPEYLYNVGSIETKYPLEELMKKGLVNDRAHAAGDAPDFSVRIREGIPQPEPVVQ